MGERGFLIKNYNINLEVVRSFQLKLNNEFFEIFFQACHLEQIFSFYALCIDSK